MALPVYAPREPMATFAVRSPIAMVPFVRVMVHAAVAVYACAMMDSVPIGAVQLVSDKRFHVERTVVA